MNELTIGKNVSHRIDKSIAGKIKNISIDETGQFIYEVSKFGFFYAEDLIEQNSSDRKNFERTILLVGGAGYIGPIITRSLLTQGYKVKCLDLLLYGNGFTVIPFLKNSNYEFIYGDICDPMTLDKSLDGITDIVILAGLVGDPITKKYPAASKKINSFGIKNLINSINNRNINNMIFVSTCSNYGLLKNNTIADENSPLAPLSLYAEAKVEIEKYILELRDNVDYCATILRFATAFGLAPRMRFDLTVNQFTYEMATDGEILVYDADTWRPYCHVEDFARLIEIVLSSSNDSVYFEVFNAGGNLNNFTKRSIVDLIKNEVPDSKIEFTGDSIDRRDYRVNFGKVQKVLGFSPKYSVKDGVHEVLVAINKSLFDLSSKPNFYKNEEISYPL